MRSHRRDRSLNVHLLEFFGYCPLAQITPNLLSSYKSKRRAEGASPRTINYELALMGHAFSMAIKEWEWVSENPVQKIFKEKVSNQVERWLTLEEEEKLLDASSDWLREIICFAVSTGLRQGEILNLRWPQIDFSRGTMSILEQKNQGKDTLPLNKTAQAILREKAKRRNGGSDIVFPNGNGQKIDDGNLRRAFYSAVRKAKIRRLRFHDLRHTFATRLVQAGVDLYAVQKLGRWKNVSMVMRYAHHYPESLRSGVEALDRFGEKLSQIYHSPIKKELQGFHNSLN
jgi:integrase